MIGQTILHYHIETLLGAGGMGSVYLATDVNLDRRVALKFLPDDLRSDPEALQRLIQEAKYLSRLKHDNILTVFTAEKHDGHHFIVMEFVEGRTLRQLMNMSDLPIERVVDIAIQIASGLGAAHKMGIIHRDLSPENILISNSGQVKIVDFGISYSLETTRLSNQSVPLGKLHYMAPERMEGEHGDHRTDLYSVGVIIYEMVVGRLPFLGGQMAEVHYAIENEQPHSLSKYRPDSPPALQAIVTRCLACNPKYRYEAVQDLAAELKALRDHEPLDVRNSQREQGMSPPRPKWRFSIAIVAVVILFSGIILGTMVRGDEPSFAARRQIVITPLRMTGNPDEQRLAEGIVSELLTMVSNDLGPGKVARFDSTLFSNLKGDSHRFGIRMNVGCLFGGEAYWHAGLNGQRGRFHLRIIRVSDDTPVWTRSYDFVFDDPLKSPFAFASTVMEELRDSLGTILTNEAGAVRSPME